MQRSIHSTEEFVTILKSKIYVKRWYPSEKSNTIPLILLHDSLGCVEMWRDFPRVLSEKLGCEVIAYDRLGFERSSSRSELPSLRFVNEEAEVYLPTLLARLGVKKFNLFGHSVGGAMAVVAAHHFADQCEGVITESAQAFVEERTLRGIAQAKVEFENPIIYAKLEKYHGEKTKWVLDAWIKVWLSPAFKSWSLKDELPKVKCPLLSIHGDRDEYGSIQFPEMICASTGGPAVKHILLNCGHNPHREQPEAVLQIVEEFLLHRG